MVGRKEKQKHKERTNRNHPGRVEQGIESGKRQQNYQIKDWIIPGNLEEGSATPLGEQEMSSSTID